MPVNSISPSQTVQQTQEIKKNEVSASRKQPDIQEAHKVKDRKDVGEQQARVQKSQAHQIQEPAKPAINTSGQKTGTLINVSA